MTDTPTFGAYIPAIVTVLTALGAGVALVLRSRTTPAFDHEQAADLLARREGLYAQLRELDDTRDRMDPPLYAKERERLVGEAAGVLAMIEAGAGSLAQAATITTAGSTGEQTPTQGDAASTRNTFSSRHPQLVGALWGAAIVGFGLLLYNGLQGYSGRRVEGQGLTGGQALNRKDIQTGAQMDAQAAAMDAQQGPQLPAGAQAELDALAAAVAADPTDLEAKNRLAHALISLDMVMEAWKLSEEVVAIEQQNPEARVHQAVMLLEIGDVPMAAKVLDKVIAGHPSQAEALGYRGAIYVQDGDKANAVATWEAAKVADPTQSVLFDELISKVDSLMMGAAAARSGEAAGMNDAAPRPTDAQSDLSARSASEIPANDDPAGEIEFSGRVSVAPGVPTPKGTLFVYVRPEGVDRGPPLRVTKLPALLPARFSISAANDPMGGGASVSGPMQITAKIDQDGNAMTTEPGNLVGKSKPIQIGDADIEVVLSIAP